MFLQIVRLNPNPERGLKHAIKSGYVILIKTLTVSMLFLRAAGPAPTFREELSYLLLTMFQSQVVVSPRVIQHSMLHLTSTLRDLLLSLD